MDGSSNSSGIRSTGTLCCSSSQRPKSISRQRSLGIENLRTNYRKLTETSNIDRLTDVDWSRHTPVIQRLDQLGRTIVGTPTVRGSSFQLFSNTEEILQAITQDVSQAKTSVLMEFYIWNSGGLSDEVLAAVMQAAKRGVSCRLLIDALGARPWWKGKQPQQLRDAGVEVLPALQVGLFRSVVGRTDLRLHRKIVVIDGQTAWTGSMNLVDPRYFKQDSGVGQWVDAMIRVQGSVVVPLAATMIGDWMLESNGVLEDVIKSVGLHLVEPQGKADIQVIASGPGESDDGLLQMILGLIYSAQNELVLTTPYLVPDDSLLRALRGAAARGVKVRLIVPEKVDSFLTRFASRSFYHDLLQFGVEIYLYRDGLLHTKSITIDSTTAMFGTVNLDMRSLWLNYEVALFIYDAEFAAQLRQLQQSYINESDLLGAEQWARRSFGHRFLENTLRLVSPLL